MLLLYRMTVIKTVADIPKPAGIPHLRIAKCSLIGKLVFLSCLPPSFDHNCAESIELIGLFICLFHLDRRVIYIIIEIILVVASDI